MLGARLNETRWPLGTGPPDHAPRVLIGSFKIGGGAPRRVQSLRRRFVRGVPAQHRLSRSVVPWGEVTTSRLGW